MSDNKVGADAQVWHWPGRIFTAADLRRQWQGQRELILTPRTLLTPLAQDELRTKGIRVTRQEAVSRGADKACTWAYWQERPDPLVASAVAAVGREGLALAALTPGGTGPNALLRSLTATAGAGSLLFCPDAALLCCL